ncbi:hypothetical protein LCGC14_2242340 [marine sediment metagenome]|uniref:Uncharacterized protein n=1 Tax=marine sediment metagenome TaxID=412755 RepID=A0A0F9D4W7_9ZZZZ
MQVITSRESEAIATVVRYLYRDEEKHWEELNKPKKHIFHSLRALHWLAYGKRAKKL